MSARTNPPATTAEVTEVLFDEPVSFEINPEKKLLSKENNDDPSHDEITALVRDCRALGLDENAVVVRRGTEWHYKRCRQWGIIVNLKGWRNPGTPYFPLEVLWFDDTPTAPRTSQHFPEDLFVIHEAKVGGEIEYTIKEQLYNSMEKIKC